MTTNSNGWGSLSSSGDYKAIPDSNLLYRYRVNEGSGTTLNDSEDRQNLSVTGSTWVNDSSFSNDVTLSYDGSDDIATSTVSESLTSGSIVTWTQPLSDGVKQKDFAKVVTFEDQSTGSGQQYNGYIDETLIYDAVLTSKEIGKLYNNYPI